MTWLRAHDPHVIWSQNLVAFKGLQCTEHFARKCAATLEGAQEVEIPSELADFQDVFSEKEADQLPPHRPYDCRIDLQPGAPFPTGRIYSMSEPELAALREFLDKNLARGFIRPSSSPLSAPVLFVKKKTGDLRLCTDYRALNAITIRNQFPLPLISELLERLREATVFTKLDLRGAYNLVRIKEGDEWKTAFGTRYGHYEYLVMPFGLTNAPAVFQHFMNDIFKDMLDRFVVIYLDDILIYSRNMEEHVRHTRQVLQRLREHDLFAKLDKCLFFQQALDYLGHTISPEGIAMDPAKVEAVSSWSPPRRVKDVQRFLGFANYYRNFFRDYAMLTLTLTQLLRKGVPFGWGKAQQEAFDTLKQAFISEPILQHPDPARPFVVETDASDVAVGAILLQDKGGELLPCAYYSRKLQPSEKNYTIWEKELLAIKAAFETWRHHLEGARHRVEVRTDHRNLEYFKTARHLNQRQIRWAHFFSSFHFRVTYIPSSQNKRADALSRKPEYNSPEERTVQTVLPSESLAATGEPVALRDQIRDAQEADDWCQQRKGDAGPGSPWTVEGGLLLHRGRLYVPTGPLRALVLEQCHDSPAAGHFGFCKTLHLVLRTFWWTRVRKDVFEYVTSCVPCRQAKHLPGPPPGLLQPLPTPDRPWGSISMDFLTDLPPSRGFTTVLVVVDMLTKMGHFIPCKGLPSATATAKLFIQNIFRLHGLPDRIVSDRGTQFTARFWKDLMTGLGVRVSLSSAHHPETDGGTERLIGILEQYLRCFTNERQDNWASLLPLAEFAYNNSRHSSTRLAPFYTNAGYHPRLFPAQPSDPPCVDTPELLSEMRAAHELARLHLDHAKEDYKKVADRGRRDTPPLAVGDLVWLSTRYLPVRQRTGKLAPRYVGPYPVEAVINPVAYRLTLPRSMRCHPVFHRSLLVPVSPSGTLRHPELSPPSTPGSSAARSTPPASSPRSPATLPAPTSPSGDEEAEIASIRDSRWIKGRFQYLVEWAGEGPEEFTWVDASDVLAPEFIHDFHSRFPSRPRPDRQPRGKGPARGDSVVSPQPAPSITPEDEDSEDEDFPFSAVGPDLGTLGEEEEGSNIENPPPADLPRDSDKEPILPTSQSIVDAGGHSTDRGPWERDQNWEEDSTQSGPVYTRGRDWDAGSTQSGPVSSQGRDWDEVSTQSGPVSTPTSTLSRSPPFTPPGSPEPGVRPDDWVDARSRRLAKIKGLKKRKKTSKKV